MLEKHRAFHSAQSIDGVSPKGIENIGRRPCLLIEARSALAHCA
jgi:hypothetical protein